MGMPCETRFYWPISDYISSKMLSFRIARLGQNKKKPEIVGRFEVIVASGIAGYHFRLWMQRKFCIRRPYKDLSVYTSKIGVCKGEKLQARSLPVCRTDRRRAAVMETVLQSHACGSLSRRETNATANATLTPWAQARSTEPNARAPINYIMVDQSSMLVRAMSIAWVKPGDNGGYGLGAASWTEIADGTLCGQDPDKIGVPARWPLDGTEDERQGFGTEWQQGGEGVPVSVAPNSLTPRDSSLAHAPLAIPG
ncbi:hypothetical protein BBK36DRAFT_1182229 [Trichoderma citrinoviride]|uniref:Uncharacterized protein n=1 Tax=Trichoderma citrinoviride TaxID=58853 RepID=A0A2T4B2I9_9HYPO|nr:hypothetical protein BBK36DRAFT_1182229 [Trichoderma citrinoviride]PTB63536.1 hypothetical protein BBK36DRAFT_1182229 [Trichoderma citrinoviride]